jgi:hypothetical protein
MGEDVIKQRLIKVADEVNARLDKLGYRCHRLKIDMTAWGEKVTIQAFNDDEQVDLIFQITEGITSTCKPSDYCEDIRF